VSHTTRTSALASDGALELRDSAGDGVSFPLVGSRRSTTATGREILADAAGVADATLQQRILGCGNWRGDYASFLRELTVASAASAETALDIAGTGLTSMRSRLVVVRGDREPSLDDALAELEPEREIGIGAIDGVEPAVTELTVPYRGRDLYGRALIEQLERWVDAGSVEPSFAEALREVAENPEWLALGGRKVALVGAGAEIGPLQPLCSWGAEVLALDVKSPAIWERITAVARRGAGTVHVPVCEDGSQGVDVVRALPETRTWLRRTAGDDDLVLGMYAYADGGEHLCVSGAFDALATDLLSHEPASALAFLATPTDAFVVPQEAVDSANAAYSARRARKVLQAPAKLLSGGRLFRAAYDDGVPVADAVVKQQGPNYALAKRCQRWRGVATESAGRQVSFNVAPATWTRSVTKNRALAAAYAGARRFGIEIFRPETTRVLMAAMLVRDLHQRPASRSQPERLFSDGAAHGGLWRAAYEPPSVLGIAALAGLPSSLLGRTQRSEADFARQPPTNNGPT
jgi:hypothetical protein